MKAALLIGVLLAGGADAQAAASPTATGRVLVLADSSLAQIRVGSNFHIPGAGLVVNVMIANDEQARLDAWAAPFFARLPKDLARQATRAGVDAALAAQGLQLATLIHVDDPRAETLERVRGGEGYDRAVLLRAATSGSSSNALQLTPDHRSLTLAIEVVELERRHGDFSTRGRHKVTVVAPPASVHLASAAEDAWAADGGRALAQAIERSVRRAIELALTAGEDDPVAGEDDYVELVTPLGAERRQGRLLSNADGEAVIVDLIGGLLVTPVLHVF